MQPALKLFDTIRERRGLTLCTLAVNLHVVFYLSAEHELFKESLEHVDESLAVFFITLQVLGNEQNQLRKEGGREEGGRERGGGRERREREEGERGEREGGERWERGRRKGGERGGERKCAGVISVPASLQGSLTVPHSQVHLHSLCV